MCESLQSCLLISDGVEDESMITKGQRSLILVFNQSRDPSCRPPALHARRWGQQKCRNKGSFGGVGAINSQRSDRGCWRNSCTLKKNKKNRCWYNVAENGQDRKWFLNKWKCSFSSFRCGLKAWEKSESCFWFVLLPKCRRFPKMFSKNVSSRSGVRTLHKLLTLTSLSHHKMCSKPNFHSKLFCWFILRLTD